MTNITHALKFKQQNKTSPDDGIIPSPFVINEGDNGRVSQQNALFFSQKVQHVPGRNFITSQFYYITSKYSTTAPSIISMAPSLNIFMSCNKIASMTQYMCLPSICILTH